MIAKLRHLVPLSIIVKLYQSPIFPYLVYGISSWGQASQSTLDKLLLLQKRAIRLIIFSPKSEHAIPFFVNLNILPVHFLYVESISCLMYDVQNKLVPARIQNLFTHVSHIHSYNTRSATTNKFYVMSSRLERLKNSFPDLACGYGMLYLKILKILPVETYFRNKYVKHLLIFSNKRICTIHHLQFLK